MSKKIQLSIAEPCHENWDGMSPVEKGKFCGSCQKQVVDFSNMSDRQVAEFFKKPSTGSVCGRFMSDQLERDIEIPRKRIPWVKYFFQIAIPAFLFSIKGSAQKTQGKIKMNTVTTDTTRKAVSNELRVLGMVSKPINVKPLMGDTILLGEVVVPSVSKSEVKGKVVNSDSIFPQVPAHRTEIVTPKIANDVCQLKDLSEPLLQKTYQLQGRVGEVIIVVGGVSAKRKGIAEKRKEEKRNSFAISMLKKTNTNSFKIFPNPVSSGSSLNIEWKQTEEGYYAFQLLNQSGQSVHQQEIWIDAEARVLNLNVPSFAQAIIFLHWQIKKQVRTLQRKLSSSNFYSFFERRGYLNAG